MIVYIWLQYMTFTYDNWYVIVFVHDNWYMIVFVYDNWYMIVFAYDFSIWTSYMIAKKLSYMIISPLSYVLVTYDSTRLSYTNMRI